MKNKTKFLSVIALLAIITLTLAVTACKDGGGSGTSKPPTTPPPGPHAPYIGTWFADRQTFTSTITITESNFDLTDSDGVYIRFDITSWTPVTTVASGNTYPTNNSGFSDYPSGFTLGVSNLSVLAFSSDTDSITVYLHKDGNSIKFWSSLSSLRASVYVKQ